MIEIGGLNGASLQMWRDFFPSVIVCVDIKPDVKRFEEERVRVEIGDSGSPEFLADLAAESVAACWCSTTAHTVVSPVHRVSAVVPGAQAGGIYIVEDLHTNYEPRFRRARTTSRSCF